MTEREGGSPQDPNVRAAFTVERYKYILQQIHAVNENVYRFLAIYQTLTVTLVGGGIALFIGYRKWQIAAATARSGIIGILCLVTIIGLFAVLMVAVGTLSWLDYRKEECELINVELGETFRRPPQARNFIRWYETYVVAFIFTSTLFLWIYAFASILPTMH
jgi:hypothetical protein